MRPSITIRDYRDSDELQVIAIARDLQVHESQFHDRLKRPEDIGPWYVDELRQDVGKHNGRFLVAECEGVVAGYATLLTEVSSEEEREEILYYCAYIGDLAVLKSHRGIGIGHALLVDCETLARAAGQKWLRLGVHAGNHEARNFYARAGLEEKFLTLEKPLT
jgi:GNAT superfamily N-acetyltransferase